MCPLRWWSWSSKELVHRWELPGNYRYFIVVMVFYLSCWRTNRILVTDITGFKVYIHIHSFMFFNGEYLGKKFLYYHGTYIYIYI